MELTRRPGAASAGGTIVSAEDAREEVSALVLGRENSGRTSLVLSLQAARAGAYSKRTCQKKDGHHGEASPRGPPPNLTSDGGLRYAVPPRAQGGLPTVLTDAQPCGVRDQVRLPGGRRL